MPHSSATVPYIELFFFAYRDFVCGADALLQPQGFGRAHHRVLHFVNRQPGMKVVQLLEILQITKQSLARVLRDLIDGGYLEQREHKRDKRARLLYLSPKGQVLANKLLELQSSLIEHALEGVDNSERAVVINFLYKMISPEHQPMATKMTSYP